MLERTEIHKKPRNARDWLVRSRPIVVPRTEASPFAQCVRPSKPISSDHKLGLCQRQRTGFSPPCSGPVKTAIHLSSDRSLVEMRGEHGSSVHSVAEQKSSPLGL